jgi:flavorubredoxin/GGDEF domain-containing protein
MGFEVPVKLNENVYWVGCDSVKLLNSNVYLFKDEDVGVLIDPAWTQAECLVDKVSKIMDLSQIKYVVVQNYEPDTVKILDTIKKLIPDVTLVTHWKISVFLNKFDLDMPTYIIDENDWKLKLKNKELEFIFTPFNYFAGSFCTYDEETRTLFSSELFSAVKNKFQLFVDRESLYLYALKTFHQLYLPIEYMKRAINNLPQNLNLVLPKYGSVLEDMFIDRVREELLSIEKEKDFSEVLEEIMPKLYEDLIYDSLEKALENLYESLKKVMPTIANVKLNMGDKKYVFGQKDEKDRVMEILRVNDKQISITIGSNVILKEKEREFLKSLARRLRNLIAVAIDRGMVEEVKPQSQNPIIDSLTGVFTRDYIPILEAKIFKQAMRHHFPIAISQIKVNFDKDVGNLYKECILREIAKVLQNKFRSSDIIIRDENKFLIIMPFTETPNAEMKISKISDELNSRTYCGSKAMNVAVGYAVKKFDESKNVYANLRFDSTDERNIKV